MTSPSAVARHALTGPARAVGGIAALTLVVHFVGLAACMQQLIGEQTSSATTLMIAMAIFASGTVAMTVALRGAIAMARLESGKAGQRGALLLCVPFWCPLAPLGILVAAWTWHTLSRPEVAGVFSE